LSVHTGTHVDAPHHFLNDGRTVESMDLAVLTGPARVVLIPDEVNIIDAAVLDEAEIPAGTERVLFKTHNSSLWQRGEKKFHPGFVSLSVEGADWLVEQGVRLVGIDYLSISPYKNSFPTHQALLRAGTAILEGVDLSYVPPGSYELYCLPLKLVGSDGSPARAILVK
jgi:arylformamidase